MESKAIMNWILCGSLAMLVLMTFSGPFLWVTASIGGGHLTMVNHVNQKGGDSVANTKLECADTKTAVATMTAFSFILWVTCIGALVVQVLITLEKLRFGIVAIIISAVNSLLSMIIFSMIAAFYGSTQCGGKVKDVAELGSAIGMYIMFWFVFAFFAVANFFVNGIKGE